MQVISQEGGKKSEKKKIRRARGELKDRITLLAMTVSGDITRC